MSLTTTVENRQVTMLNLARLLPKCKPAGQNGLEDGVLVKLPVGLDPEHHRIILAHLFGQVGAVADLSDVSCPARLVGDT